MHEILTIKWQMQKPPVAPFQWYRWEGLPQKNSEMTESPLFPNGLLEPQSIHIMNKALALGLDRFCGWDLSEIPEDEQGLFIRAANFYKRGVAYRSSTENNKPITLSGSYQLRIFKSTEDIEPVLNSLPSLAEAFVVCDLNVKKYLTSKNLSPDFSLNANEKQKTLQTIAEILSVWKSKASKKHWIIFGGGITADIAAFAAAMAQSSFSLVPTTLLSIVDACIGGKTGVNAPPYGKNQIGSFAFPEGVYIWPRFLRSLETREIRNGGAECLKHSYLAGKPHLAATIAGALDNKNLDIIEDNLLELIQLKSEVVAEDPGESGRRVVLNLGHTLAHALEAVSHQEKPINPIAHGEAVAIGLLFCFQLSKDHLDLKQEDFTALSAPLFKARILLSKDILENHLASPLESVELWEKIWSFISHDKKKTNKSIKTSSWVLLREKTEVFMKDHKTYTVLLDKDQVKHTWDKFVKHYTF